MYFGLPISGWFFVLFFVCFLFVSFWSCFVLIFVLFCLFLFVCFCLFVVVVLFVCLLGFFFLFCFFLGGGGVRGDCQFIETSTTKSLPLVSASKGLDLFCKFGMAFTWTKHVEKGSYPDRDVPVIVRNELSFLWTLVYTSCVSHYIRLLKNTPKCWQ